MLVSVPKINTARTRVQRSSWCSRKNFCVFNVLRASTSPNSTKCSTKLRGTSVGEVNEFLPYSICLIGLLCLHAMCFEKQYWFYSQAKETLRFLQNHSPPQLICLIATELIIIVWRRSSKSWLRNCSDKRYKFSCQKKAAYAEISVLAWAIGV